MYFEYWLIITLSLSLSLSRSLFVRLYSLFFISCFCSFLHHLNQLRCIDFCANYLPLPDTLCFAVFSLFCICFVFYFCANASGHQLNLLVQMYYNCIEAAHFDPNPMQRQQTSNQSCDGMFFVYMLSYLCLANRDRVDSCYFGMMIFFFQFA